MEVKASFNLVDQPWICVRNMQGDREMLSMLEVFRRADQLSSLANDVPTQDFVILRTLLSVLTRSLQDRLDDFDNPCEAWGALWQERTIPYDAVEAYLQKWYERFDLFDEKQPFMQVAGMRASNGSVSEVKKLLIDVPDGLPLFCLRSGEGLESLEYAEAARWLLHVHAFDTAGIKTGVVGDPGVKGGKSYPIGTGWAGRIGGVYLEGATLAETLLLNLVLCDDCYDALDDLIPDDDLPAWEQPQKTPGDDARPPTGFIDAYSWQTRRVRLLTDGTRVTSVVLTNGDKLESVNQSHIEPMTAWRRSKNQEKAKGLSIAYLPSTHHSDRSIWRGLTSVLPGVGEDVRAPGVVMWAGHLASLNGGKKLSDTYPVRIHATGLEYGVQSSVVSELIDDTMVVNTYLMTEQGHSAALMAVECMTKTGEATARVLGELAKWVALAAGDDTERANSARDGVVAEAYFELDAPYRRWLSELGPSTDLMKARDAWYGQARALLQRISRRIVAAASPDAVVGRRVKLSSGEQWITVSKAEQRFTYWLYKTLPERAEQTEEEGKEV